MIPRGRLLGPLLFFLLGTSLLATAALGIDVVLVCTAKIVTLQAARAGAMAGAGALAADARDLRGAAQVARAFVERPGRGSPAILVDEQGLQIGREEVTVTARHAETLPTLLAHLLTGRGLEVRASARAAVVMGTSTTCLRPWIFADGFADAEPRNGVFGQEDSYEAGVTSWGTTVRDGAHDRGRRIALHQANPNDVTLEGFHAIDLRGGDGPGDAVAAYARNLARCSDDRVSVGDTVPVLSSPVEDATLPALRALIDMDPQARWDEATGGIAGSAWPAGASPRIARVVFSDPRSVPGIRQAGAVTVVNIGAVFIEAAPGGGFTGRLMHATGSASSTGRTAAMTRAVRMVP